MAPLLRAEAEEGDRRAAFGGHRRPSPGRGGRARITGSPGLLRRMDVWLMAFLNKTQELMPAMAPENDDTTPGGRAPADDAGRPGPLEAPNPSHVVEQLLIARYLFKEGERAADSRLPFAPGLAVSLFQDAAELVLACVAHSVDAKVGRDTAFLAYWDAIEKAPKNEGGKPVPSKAALARLNAARVAFKHHGQRIDAEAASRFRIDTEVFLKETTVRYFGLEFDDVSMADLIVSPALRDMVKEAEGHMAQDRFKEGFECCAVAALDLRKSMAHVVPELDSWSIERAAEDIFDDHRAAFNAKRLLGYVAEQLNAHGVALSMLFAGLDVDRHAHFLSLVPSVSRMYGGRLNYTWKRRIPKEPEAVRSQLSFCIDYVVDFALAVQRR